MTFRGTVINGVIVPDSGQTLPEGTRVSLSPLPKRSSRSRQKPKATGARTGQAVAKKRKPAKKKAAKQKIHPLIALSGIWKDRPEWEGKSSIEIVAELRRSTGRPRG